MDFYWPDHAVLHAIERAFDITWPVIHAHEAGNDKARIAELSMMLSYKLVELATDGVTDPQELRKLALATFPLISPHSKGNEATSSLRDGSWPT